MGIAFNHTLFPPRFEVLGFANSSWILYPLNYLGHSYEVHVFTVFQNFVNPEQESVQELGVVLQPSGVEVQSEWCPVFFVVTLEVVVQEIVELVTGENVGARIDHSTTGYIFVDGGVFSSVKFVEHHFPNGMAPGGTALEVAVATMGHTEVHGVRPQRRVAQGCGDGRIVQEGLFFHHRELVVTTHS